jgi:tRNA dimethylallyltransferase
VVALLGPTGSGKSALALRAAAEAGRGRVEVVAIDAFTVYRGMDVGTAKPSRAERQTVPHHMVDVLWPHEECTVQWFQAAARRRIADVRARGAVPLLVGGSGLYWRAVVDPLEFPPTDPAVRAAIEERYAGAPRAAHAALADIDHDAAARIDPDNLRRSVRALEVVELTGRPFSAWRTAWETHESIYDRLAVVGLYPGPEALAARIDARAADIVAAGLLAEARALATRPHGLSTTARQAIGYTEALAALAGRAKRDESAEQIAARTRRFAARQRRWFSRDPRVRWEEPDAAARSLSRALVAAAEESSAERSQPPSSS